MIIYVLSITKRKLFCFTRPKTHGETKQWKYLVRWKRGRYHTLFFLKTRGIREKNTMSPILFKIGPIFIYSYGLMIGIGIVLAMALSERDARRLGLNHL